MPPETTELEGAPGTDDPVETAVAAVEAQIAGTPAEIRNSPEFQALANRARADARRAGTATRNANAARREVETMRQAAEAERFAAAEAQIGELPEDAVAAYQELAELGQSDPVAAATRFAEMMANAQSAPAAATEEAPTTPPTEATVPEQAPPPMLAGVSGSVPLSEPVNDGIAELRADLDRQYAEVVERNQSATTRNRVTMRERARGFIAYVASAYLGNEELARISAQRARGDRG